MRFSKAPIIEAVLEIKVKLPDGFDATSLEQFQAHVSGYPNKQNFINAEIVFSEGEVLPEPKHSLHGYRFISDDQRKIVQARIDGFAFSLLAPYSNWEDFRDLARSLWNEYRLLFSPTDLTRIALRYINRLDIPQDSIELKDYLRTVPEIAPELPQGLQGYTMQLVSLHSDIQAIAVITQTLVPPLVPDTTSILLDIDVFRDQAVPNSDEDIWQLFEGLRDRKNKIFDVSLTQKAKDLIR